VGSLRCCRCYSVDVSDRGLGGGQRALHVRGKRPLLCNPSALTLLSNCTPFSCVQGDRYCDRVVMQDEQYMEIRDGLRNARKKKDGKVDAVAPLPAAKTATAPAAG
jgi:hypothetical protein